MANLRAGIAGWLVCFLLAAVALAQSDSSPKDPTAKDRGDSEAAAENSKNDDDENPFKKKKQVDDDDSNPFKKKKKTNKVTDPKDSKEQSSKSTGKKSASGKMPLGGADDDSAAPAGLKGSQGDVNPNVKQPERNWSAEKIVLSPHDAERYVRDAVTIAPTNGQKLIQGKFEITATRPDSKAIDRYVRAWPNADRRELTRNVKAGARIIEARNIALVGPDGKRYPAIWSLNEGVRIRIVNSDIAPNRQSSQESVSGPTNPSDNWIGAEQSFVTRVTRPLNQPPITEYATFFTGMLRTDHAVPVSFLFSVPTSIEMESLSLAIESETFAIDE